jgi:hypothetical protein
VYVRTIEPGRAAATVAFADDADGVGSFRSLPVPPVRAVAQSRIQAVPERGRRAPCRHEEPVGASRAAGPSTERSRPARGVSERPWSPSVPAAQDDTRGELKCARPQI